MPKDVMYGKTLRKSYARVPEEQEMPHLLEIQKNSYNWFLEKGLREVFDEEDAVSDYTGKLELSFINYSMTEKPKYSEQECKARDTTYAAPLKQSRAEQSRAEHGLTAPFLRLAIARRLKLNTTFVMDNRWT